MADDGDAQLLAPPAPPADDEQPEGAPDWIVTFADLATLLLCFFVLLLSFSRMDQERFKEVAGSLKEAFGVQRVVPVFDIPRGIDLIARDFNTTFTADLVDKIRSAIKQAGGKAEGATVEESARGLLINLPGAILFDSASADLSPGGRAVLAAVVPIIKEVGGEVHIEGHTDATPFGASVGVLDGNWRLSFDRALGVVEFFVAEGGFAPGTLVPIGRGASVPIASNDTPEGMGANRRVEILILKGFSLADEEDLKVAEEPRAAAPAGSPEAAGGDDGLAPELHIPESGFSPTERTVEHSGGPVSLFPDDY